LVTGFEPFGNHLVNISGEVASAIDGRIIRNSKIESHVLSVDETGSMFAGKLIQSRDFSAIVHIGLAENAELPRVEMRAKDILDFRIPDNSGRQIRDEKISGDGDLFSTINPNDWDLNGMIDHPIISNDAGEFLCNETLYRTLLALKSNKKIPCFFLHLPLREKLTDPIGLVIECIDRMLRPECLDVGAGAIISDGKFLAARRAPSEKHAGWWEFPGGKFEDGEDARACLVREISEELELEVSVHDKIGIWIFDHGDVVVRLHVYVCKIESGEIVLNVHDKIKWCTGPDEVPWLGPDFKIAEAISAR
jgi:8-oxo-dGTP diphosphatase